MFSQWCWIFHLADRYFTLDIKIARTKYLCTCWRWHILSSSSDLSLTFHAKLVGASFIFLRRTLVVYTVHRDAASESTMINCPRYGSATRWMWFLMIHDDWIINDSMGDEYQAWKYEWSRRFWSRIILFHRWRRISQWSRKARNLLLTSRNSVYSVLLITKLTGFAFQKQWKITNI